MVIAAMIAILFSGQLAPERRVLLPYDYGAVRITDGLFKRQIDEAKEFYLRIPNDDLLLGFRRRAGLPAPGHELGGWYGDDVFHIFGQVLSGLARLYAATGDQACKEKACALLDGWAETIAPDGYFYYSNKPNAPHYIYDKMVGGLVDMWLFCDRPDALDDLSRITQWAIKHLDRKQKWLDGGEWYTLSENLYRAFDASGSETYRDFARVWEYKTYWSAFAEKRDIFAMQPDGNETQRYHAYSHVNTLGGAAWAYRVCGERAYLDTVLNAYDFLQANEVFATGGFGPDESIVPPDKLASLLESTNATFETQCGSWAVFKLCKNLISLTGDAKYGDWIEKVAYNGVAATIPMTADGQVFYYSDYNPFGGTKFNNSTQWTCCAGTRPMAAADVDDLIYFSAPDGVDVNLFVPSTLPILNGKVIVHQETRFPDAPSTELSVWTPKPTRFTMRVRRPGWLTGRPSATLNGKPVLLKFDDKHWMTVARTWSNSDRLKVSLPMSLHKVPLSKRHDYPTALEVGPIVLACRSSGESPVKQIDLDNLSSAFEAIPGEPLTYRLKKDPSVLARPFYSYKPGEEYFLYLDPITLRTVPFRRMKREGHWNEGSRFLWSNEAGAWMEGSFTGDSVKLIGWAFDDGGRGEIKIDGKVVGTIDQFGHGRDLPWDWKIDHLGQGRHTLRVTVLHEKADASKDAYVNVGGLEIP